MVESRDWLSLTFGLKSVADEVIPAGARVDRAIFWPSFGPYAVITIRDFDEVGEVELVASGLKTHHFLYSYQDPPERWSESCTVEPVTIAGFRLAMIEARPEGLGDVWPVGSWRDGLGFEGAIRRGEAFHRFQIHDDVDLWKGHPSHERYFQAVWRIAIEVLRDDWSCRVLDPRHYGDLLAREVPRAVTKRRRS